MHLRNEFMPLSVESRHVVACQVFQMVMRFSSAFQFIYVEEMFKRWIENVPNHHQRQLIHRVGKLIDKNSLTMALIKSNVC